MSHTNNTQHYNFPQFVGTDTPGWLTDVNSAFSDIDSAIYARQQSIATNANDISSLQGRTTAAETNISDLDTAINDPTTGILARLTADETNIQNNTNNIGTNSTNINALNNLVSNLQAKLPVTTSTTLYAANWVSGVYNIADTNVTNNSIIDIGFAGNPTSAEIEAWNDAVIVPGTVTAGTGFTIIASETTPTTDISVIYTRWEA